MTVPGVILLLSTESKKNIMEVKEQSPPTTEAPVTTIAQIGTREGQTVTIRGWLYNLRESGKLLFPIFRDGSGLIQGVVPKAAVSPKCLTRLSTSRRNRR